MQIGNIQQFVARGYFRLDGGWFDLTHVAIWGSESPGVVTVTKGGLATVVGQGFSSISARLDNVLNRALLTTTLTTPLTRPTVRPVLLEASDKSFPAGAEAVIDAYWKSGLDWTELMSGITLSAQRTVSPRIMVPFTASELSNVLGGLADNTPLYDWLRTNTPLNRDGVEETWLLFWWGPNVPPFQTVVFSTTGYTPVTITQISHATEWSTYPWMLAAGLISPDGRPNLSPDAGVGVMLHELIHAIANMSHENVGIMGADWALWPNTVIGPVALEGLRTSPYRMG
jgi:hypothetical protein